jgi:hypothetical protein
LFAHLRGHIMNSPFGIKMLLGALAIAVLSGCALPEVRTAPLPTTQQLALNRQVQSRVIAIPVEGVFPKVLDVLMDNGFIIRSINEKAGFVSFYQQWVDKSQRYANITIEGSLLFTSAGPNSTLARVLLTGSWQIASYGGVDSATSMVRGVQQSTSGREYAMVLDVIDRGLAPGR